MADPPFRLGRLLRGQADVFVDGERIGKVRRSQTGHGWDALDRIDRLISCWPSRAEAAAAVFERWSSPPCAEHTVAKP